MDLQSMENEVMAWRGRFPQYEFRPQDECVALKSEKVLQSCHRDSEQVHHKTQELSQD